ncbi:MAG: transposase [Candidatus Micrarchaeota archaeon]|nr:transposase [Candidatus Micrarchaeota archaeon]
MTDENSLTNCPNCGSPDFVKNGRRFNGPNIYQAYLCHSCGLVPTLKLHGTIERKVLPVEQITLPEYEERPIDWPAYNEAQVAEKLRFLELLGDLCSFIPEEDVAHVGRPRASKREMVFCMVAKLYEVLSSRRVSSDLEIAKGKGYLNQVPHFNTILKYFNDSDVSPLLDELIRFSALPLRDFETSFAVDASGLSSAFYSRWLDERIDPCREHEWIKIHVACGVKTNIITAITVTDGHSNDSPHFPKLVKQTAEHFRVREVSADKAYSSRSNLEAVFGVGGIPYIPFRSNTTGKSGGSMAWQRMFHYFQLHKEAFMERYHQRSNVESSFSMLKRKFSGKLMMKNEVAQVNEALAKLLCHNLCVLVRESCEMGFTAEFEKSAHLFPNLHIKEGPILKNG